MPDPRTVARTYGVAIELADLGDWADAVLVSEYDPDGPVIRINTRAMPHGSSSAMRAHIDAALKHELYHHREAIGEFPRTRVPAARERLAAEHRLE